MAGVPWPLLPYARALLPRQARLLVMAPDPVVEIAGQPADDRLVARVGEAQARRW
jgi:hypothetical protein